MLALLAALLFTDLTWYPVNDNVMGGRSLGDFRVEDEILVFEGSLNTDGGGFASIRSRTGSLSGSGVRLRARGDGRVYSLRLQQGQVSYRARFETGAEWREVWLPYGDFVPTWRGRVLERPPVDPAEVDSIGLMIADGIDGEFRLEVETIETYAPFSIRDYLWKARPLLIFADSADDPRVKEQLRGSEAGFRERQIVPVLVLNEGSRAGSRPLSADEADELRRQFEAESFQVLLVGKDGGVKRRSDRPVALDTLYEQIDAMPMRRSEMRERTP